MQDQLLRDMTTELRKIRVLLEEIKKTTDDTNRAAWEAASRD